MKRTPYSVVFRSTPISKGPKLKVELIFKCEVVVLAALTHKSCSFGNAVVKPDIWLEGRKEVTA